MYVHITYVAWLEQILVRWVTGLFSSAVEEVRLKDSQYTLDHVRAFGMYNLLHLDPWYPDSVFFVDCKGRVLNLTVTLVWISALIRSPFRDMCGFNFLT